MCFFFFFKQKTAYEMCGRDWSSDVCSSDLIGNSLKYSRNGPYYGNVCCIISVGDSVNFSQSRLSFQP